MLKKKRFIWTVSILLVVALGGILVLPSVLGMGKSELSVDNVAFNKVELTTHALTLSGSLTSSAISYRDYWIRQDGSNLYVTLEGGMVTKKHASGDFDIHIRDEGFSKVDRVYLKYGENHTLIFPQS